MITNKRPDGAPEQDQGMAQDIDLVAFGRAARQATPPPSPWLRTRIMARIDEAETDTQVRRAAAPAFLARLRGLFTARAGYALGGLVTAGLCVAVTAHLLRAPDMRAPTSGPSVADAWVALFGESETPLTGVAALLDFSDADSETTLLADLGDMFTDLPLLGPLEDAEQDAGLDFLDLEDATDGGLLS